MRCTYVAAIRACARMRARVLQRRSQACACACARAFASVVIRRSYGGGIMSSRSCGGKTELWSSQSELLLKIIYRTKGVYQLFCFGLRPKKDAADNKWIHITSLLVFFSLAYGVFIRVETWQKKIRRSEQR